MVSNRDAPKDLPLGAIDPYALVEALVGRKLDRRSTSSDALQGDYDDLVDVKHDSVLSSKGPEPDSPPKDLHVGCINPYALVEALIGRKVDRCSMSSARILSDVLQTDYDELFDMKHNSVLFAGLKLNREQRKAEEFSDKEIGILNERDLETPDLSRVKKVNDLEKLGMKDISETEVKMARMQNGKLRLVLYAHSMGKKVSNREVTMSLNELALPFRKQKGQWTPPNSSWRDMYENFFQCASKRIVTDIDRLRMVTDVNRFHIGHDNYITKNKFEDPVQGATSNSWLIAAIFSVFWADPSIINRCTRALSLPNKDEKKRVLAVKFHDKGGQNNSHTATIEVNYEIPINNSDDEPLYCHSSDGCEIWPSLYEKAFTKWMTGGSSDRPDITQTHNGDPIKAMAQINGREPQYFFTDKHPTNELVGLVRSCSVNFKTIQPMCAYTYATGDMYRGSNLVANHAYSVLGWTSTGQNQYQYIILRNPFGVTEPAGLTSYPGLVDRVEPEFWRPASLLDCGGVLALEASFFKQVFACIGVAK